MDGPETEIVMVAIKMRINYFFLSRLIFCNSNFVALSTMYGEMHGGRHVVQSLMVVENRAIRFAGMIF
jgi:hypothetical protein